MFESILVCNRGEIAVRILRTCRELGIRSILAHSSADGHSLAAQLADETFCLGPPEPTFSYRSVPAILYACARTRAAAVHPGYGFLAESPSLAQACADTGLTFIGPPVSHLELFGDKIASRAAMERAGVPILPGCGTPLESAARAMAVADELGYPVALKAASGGGGQGVTRVDSAASMNGAFTRAHATARKLFDDPRLYLEKYLPHARHVEVQIAADSQGRVVHLGERDCSVQRRHQKIVEQSPAAWLSDQERAQIHAYATAGAKATGLRNIATFEFLLDEAATPYFIEVNPRLQVEHTVTEAVTGIDLVSVMIHEAAGAGNAFLSTVPKPRGHAIELRITAEDPTAQWRPETGSIEQWDLPSGPGVRVDTGITAGDRVTPYYDSLLAKIVTWAPSRAQACRRSQQALREFRCTGLQTNVDALRHILTSPQFQRDRYFLDTTRTLFADHSGARSP